MKKDILKEFVSENRDDFDDQEPSSDILNKIQSRLGLEQAVVSPRAKVIKWQYWWAAAAVMVVIIGFAVLFQQNKTTGNSIANKTTPVPVIPTIRTDKKDSMATVQSIAPGIADPEQKRAVVKRQQKIGKEKNNSSLIDPKAEIVAFNTIADDWERALQNESSSVRLAAILACGKRNAVLSGSDLQILYDIMNNDENSNVRLAALDVLKKEENREAVKNLILQSVAKQDDPVVQMELLASLSSDEATKVQQQLLAITQDPMNIDAVRNQAYAALLRSKSNF